MELKEGMNYRTRSGRVVFIEEIDETLKGFEVLGVIVGIPGQDVWAISGSYRTGEDPEEHDLDLVEEWEGAWINSDAPPLAI